MAFTKPVPILTEFLYSNHPLKMRVNEKEQGKKNRNEQNQQQSHYHLKHSRRVRKRAGE